ncbi:MAG: hypothetical protein GY771_16835 [bacterium]|nr:hypothetical protein [bacterium]
MRKYLLVAVLALAVGLTVFGCGKKDKGKFDEIEVEDTTTTTTTTTIETLPETIPVAPVYEPTKQDVLDQLYETLGASEKTLGWDNVYCSISLDKSVTLFEVLAPAYKAGSSNYTFCNDSIATLSNIKTNVDSVIAGTTALDPTGTNAKDWRKDINKIRDKVGALKAGPAPAKEPIPEWQGDLMKEKWHERGEMMKKKWAER